MAAGLVMQYQNGIHEKAGGWKNWFSVSAMIAQAQYVDFFIDRLPHVVILKKYPSLKKDGFVHRPHL
jgi:hypothetical protein